MSESEIYIGLGYDFHRTTLTPAAAQTWGDADGYRIAAHPYVQASILKAIDTFNKHRLDLTVWGGDLINGGALGAVREANFDAFVADLATLTPLFYYLVAHWDLGASIPYDADDYAQFFHATEGIGSLVPTGDDAPADPWWPVVAADDSAVAYSIVKNNFKLIFLASIMNSVGFSTAGQVTGLAPKTQLQWFQDRLDEAEANSQHVIVFSHQALKTNDALDGTDNAMIEGFADGISALESQTLESVVFSGHIHRDDSVIVSNGVSYINFHGDVHGETADDTDRFSPAIVKIVSGSPPEISVSGYGYQSSRNLNVTNTGFVG